VKTRLNRNIRPPYFFTTILTFLAPLLLSIMILGFLSVQDTQSYVRDSVHRANSNILRQTGDSIDAIIDELNIITLNFSINTKVQAALRRILQKEYLDYEEIKELEIIQNMLSISHYSRAYIQSIYAYFDNPKKRFITSEMVNTSIDTFPDKAWFESYLREPGNKPEWWESREIPRGGPASASIPVVTFYKKIYNSSLGGYNGVVVFNVYAAYIRQTLNSLESFDHQTILILDQSNNPISKNNGKHDFLIPSITGMVEGESAVSFGGKAFTVAQGRSKYGLKYISIVPNETLYKLPDYLFRLNILYIFVSLVIGMGLSLYFAHNSNRQIRTILDIIASAKEGKTHSFSDFQKPIRNSYQYIVYNILNTFIEKDYLAVQLSEKMYKSKVDELTALQSQINPHFLFNTLQTINMRALSLTSKKNDVSDMIEHLSVILRYSLSDPADVVSLEQEIAHAKSYLAIQTVRYKDKIRIEWIFDGAVLRYGTIKLLLQPLLENSIYHGIKESETPGIIRINIGDKEDTVTILLEDTGIGIEPDKLREIQAKLTMTDEKFEHIGLYNTNRRIKLTFGEKYGIKIRSEQGKGTGVEISLPKIRV
jgi:two-component system sensor histidine kinase YesM